MPEEFTPPQQAPTQPYGTPAPPPAHGYVPANGQAQPGYAPNGYAPNGYAPNGYAPNGHAPNGHAPNGYAPVGHAPAGYAPVGYAPAPMVSPGQYAAPSGPLGKIRPTGVSILLCIVTLGIYALYYYFATHDEMKRHTGQGLGGGLALVIAIIFGIASPFLLSSEVGGLYERTGRAKPVSGATGLWYLLGSMIIVGPIVWFVKTNGALNAYWRSLGAS